MLPGTARAKGNAWETVVAKDLSLWVTHNARHDVFDRSPVSGAKATMHKNSGAMSSAIAGDIIAVAPEGHQLLDYFVVECKHRASIGIEQMLWKPSSVETIGAWWEKLVGDCLYYKKLPIIIAKQNNRLPILGLSRAGTLQFSPAVRRTEILSHNELDLHLFFYKDFLTFKFLGFNHV